MAFNQNQREALHYMGDRLKELKILAEGGATPGDAEIVSSLALCLGAFLEKVALRGGVKPFHLEQLSSNLSLAFTVANVSSSEPDEEEEEDDLWVEEEDEFFDEEEP